MVQSCLLLRSGQENQSEGTPPYLLGGGVINPVLALYIYINPSSLHAPSAPHMVVEGAVLRENPPRATKWQTMPARVAVAGVA